MTPGSSARPESRHLLLISNAAGTGLKSNPQRQAAVLRDVGLSCSCAWEHQGRAMKAVRAPGEAAGAARAAAPAAPAPAPAAAAAVAAPAAAAAAYTAKAPVSARGCRLARPAARAWCTREAGAPCSGHTCAASQPAASLSLRACRRHQYVKVLPCAPPAAEGGGGRRGRRGAADRRELPRRGGLLRRPLPGRVLRALARPRVSVG
jgi:hypothetical protein